MDQQTSGGEKAESSNGDQDVRTSHADLKCKILTRPAATTRMSEDYAQAYSLWKTVWSETFKELDGASQLYSDEFSRPEEIICVFSGPRCIALCTMRWVDLTTQVARDDSYFKQWRGSPFFALEAKGTNIAIGGYLTIHPEARGSRLGFPMVDVLIGLQLKRFLASDADAVVGAVRFDRGLHAVASRFGGQILGQTSQHNTPVSLVTFDRNNTRDCSDVIVSSSVDFLWKSIPPSSFVQTSSVGN